MQTPRRRLDHWLFEEYRTDRESLAIFRIFFAAYVLLDELPTGLWTEPAAAYSPPVSFAAFFTAPPPHFIMVALNAVTLLATAMLLVGMYTKWSSLVVAFGTMAICSFCFSDGKIDEGLVIWVALILAGSGWGAAFSVDSRRGRVRAGDTHRDGSWLVAVLVMVIGFALFTAGSAKVRGGWLNPHAYATRYHLFWDYYVYGRKTPLATWAWQNMPPWAWKIGDISTVIWEVGFVLTIVKRSWCRLACAAGAGFHVGVWLLFDIEVTSNAVAYAVLVNWPYVFPKLRDWLAQLGTPAGAPRARLLCALPFLYAACSLFLFPGRVNAVISMITGKLVLAAALVMAVGYAVFLAREASSKALAPSTE